MESINSIFAKNCFATKPIKHNSSKNVMTSLVGQDILYPKKKIENEMSFYIDILFNNHYKN